MKIFIDLSESPLKVRKIAVYCFLILFLVPELFIIIYFSHHVIINTLKFLKSNNKNIMEYVNLTKIG